MSKFPFYKQLDAMDCGPASLKIICKHYGKDLSMKYLRDKCNITREGVSLLDISKAGEEIGLRTLPLKVSYEDLQNKIPLPAIIHWNYAHFVVVYKITKNKVYVSDPQIGLMSYSKDEFNYNWKKKFDKWYVLTLEPRIEFSQQENIKTSSRLTEFYKYILVYKKYFLQIFLGIILTLVLSLIFPMISQSVVDIGIGTKDISFVNTMLLAGIILTLSSVASSFTQNRLMLYIADKVNISMVSDFIYKLLELPLPFFERKTTSDILARIADHGRIQTFIFQVILGSISSILTLVVFACILIYYDYRLFIVFVVAESFNILWILLFLPSRKKMDYKFFDASIVNSSKVLELVDGVKEIKVNNLQQQKRWDWEKSRFEIYTLNFKLMDINQFQDIGGVLLGQIKNIFLTFITAKAVIDGTMTLGMMLSVQYIIGQLNGPVGNFLKMISSFQDAKISLERVNEIVYEEKPEINYRGFKMPMPSSPSITLENVSFKYNKNYPNVLEKINLVIPNGKITAIVGESGSGKSTLMKLLLRLYEPTEGELMINDVDFYSIDLNEWREKCGAILQDGVLFSGNIIDNITLTTENADINIKQLKYAIKSSNLEEYINDLPLKHNTVVGQGGTGMSGGQKQRILIARALYKNPDFLFMDEATNSLDANNEKIISDNLTEFSQGKTTIVIAHRLSTVMNAHQIVVFDKGKIMEIGNHQDLIEKNGIYYNLIKNQMFIKN